MGLAVNKEALQIAEAVAREKGIDPEEVFIAMEEAIQKIGRTKYGHENDIRAFIDRVTGDVNLARYREVVELVENPSTQILLEDAQELNSALTVGEFVVDPLPPISFGRVSAQSARQIIGSRVRQAERQKQFDEFKDKIGQIVTGTVKRVDFGNYIIDVGRLEASLRRDECIPRENLRTGDRVRCYILDVNPETRGPMIQLSRAHPNFMAKLFEQEVPEIADGTIEIVSVARDPGSRAKIAIRSEDASIDPVGACVGMRGSRIQAIVNELQGEKVDIVLWSPNQANFIINALAPAEISKVIFDESTNQVDVVVPEAQQSIAIGRRGQNVRLASLLTGLNVNILTEDQEASSRAEENKEKSELFIKALDVDEVIGHLLAVEDFKTIEEIAGTPLEELLAIEGFDEDLATELQKRSLKFLEAKTKELKEKLKGLKVDKKLEELEGVSLESLVKLAEQKVKTLDDLADLSTDELLDIVGKSALTRVEADALIMRAREHWFQ
ncbi:MAG: transcription termination factor NusA [Alphaproteobacteria bacterium]